MGDGVDRLSLFLGICRPKVGLGKVVKVVRRSNYRTVFDIQRINEPVVQCKTCKKYETCFLERIQYSWIKGVPLLDQFGLTEKQFSDDLCTPGFFDEETGMCAECRNKIKMSKKTS